MALSVLSLLTPSLKADPTAAAGGIAAGGQSGQDNASNPFAQMLEACQQGGAAANVALDTDAAKALVETFGIVQALEDIQAQLEVLPPGANLAESLEDIAAFQALPVPVQDRILEAVNDGTIENAASLVLVLEQVQQAVVKTLPEPLQIKWQAHVEAMQKAKGDKNIVLVKEENQKDELSAEAQSLAAALMQLLNPLAQAAAAGAWDGKKVQDMNAEGLTDVLVISTTPPQSNANNTLLDNIDDQTTQDIPTLTTSEQGNAAGQGNDNAGTQTNASPANTVEEVNIDPTVILDEAVKAASNTLAQTVAQQQAAANAGAGVAIEDGQQQAQLDAMATAAALHAEAQETKATQEEHANAQALQDDHVLVPMQPVRLSRASAGGQSRAGESHKTNTSLSTHTLMLGGGMVAQLSAHGATQDVSGARLKAGLETGHAANQILGKITLKPHRDSNEYNIQLDPIELGKVEIKMDINSNGEVKLSIMAESRHALEALQRDARMLEKGLQDAGLKLDSSNLSFDLKDQSQQSAAGAFADGENRDGGQRASSADARVNGGYRDANTNETTLDIVMPYRAATADGLDIRV